MDIFPHKKDHLLSRTRHLIGKSSYINYIELFEGKIGIIRYFNVPILHQT